MKIVQKIFDLLKTQQKVEIKWLQFIEYVQTGNTYMYGFNEDINSYIKVFV